MKKLVQENLTEEWVSTDTGVQLYGDYPSQNGDIMPEMGEEVIKKLVPPPTERFSEQGFAEYVNFLMGIVSKSPILAITVFKETIKAHPYLSKKPIGFKTVNPFEP